MSGPNIAAVVLAAGKSQRFGSDKRRYQLDGQPLLQHALSKPLQANLETVLVLKPEDKNNLQALLGQWHQHPLLRLCYSPQSERGMAYSLAAAASQALMANYDGLLVLLGDMPALNVQTLQIIQDHFQKEKISVPCYRGQQGHPVLFPRQWFEALSVLEGDAGAKSILNNNPEQVCYIQVGDAGIIWDLDNPPGT